MAEHCERNKNPLEIAENLCVECAVAGIGKTGKTPSLRLSRSWRILELAIAEQSHDRLNTAKSIIYGNYNRTMGRDVRIKYDLSQAFLPAAKDRLERHPISDESRHFANSLYGETLQKICSIGAIESGLGAEVLALYLMSRPGVDANDFLMPGSPREERSNLTRLNHDAYLLWPRADGSQGKYAFSLKRARGKQGDYDIPSLSMTAVMEPVLSAINSQDVSSLITMSAFESQGKTGDFQETVLDFATHCLKTAVTNPIYIDQIKNIDIL